MELFGNIVAIALLVLGFGFVVFVHELGHFLAAKWVGIRVEQFAIGFGHAIAAWRKGVGLRWGTTTPEYERRIREQVALVAPGGGPANISAVQEQKAAAELGLGETEYRFNWLPLGGYVKMLGQDDLNPNAQADDPRAYNRKSIGARMLVVSAGVIMNVIFAAIGFMIVFLMGFHVAPPVIGNVETNSPAQLAGLRVGDRVIELEGQRQHDFTKLMLNSALVPADRPVPILVERHGKLVELSVRPQRPGEDTKAFLQLGIGLKSIEELRGLDAKFAGKVKNADGSDLDPATKILPGEIITAINGKPVGIHDYEVFDRAVQESGGKPVVLTVQPQSGQPRTVEAPVSFQPFFGTTPFNFAGLQPRTMVKATLLESPLKDKLKPGDVVTALVINGETRANPTVEELIRLINQAGEKEWKVDFIVERDGKRVNVDGIVPSVRTMPGKRGVGIQPVISTGRPIVAGVLENSAANRAHIPAGALVTRVNGTDVSSWFDVHSALRESSETPELTYVQVDGATGEPTGAAQSVKLTLSDAERQTLQNIRYAHDQILKERIVPRQTNNPLEAAAWGVTETRDLLLQFYVTLHRLTQGSVSATNFMGPIGIVHAGSLFAFRGWDWLIWFLAMISANLAVVNFLPIPIVDGGLFVFLIVEKIQGRPLSPRVQTVAQLVGLAIILSVFLLVTYQDIWRLVL